ncbi:lactonase family protein [Luteococcus sp. Sow4_B9]|uniref:lactonase family protein n=1 Tax=Luteococcus sp. Sow4_B9 TaxID=3438792 RepID=UPI003F997D74
MTQIVSTTCAADGTITTFTLNGETLVPLGTSPVGKGVSAMAPDATGLRAHVSLKEPAGVATVALNPDNGIWTQTSHRPLPTHPSYLVRSHDGRFLLGADYGRGVGTVWPVAADGSLGEPTASVEHKRLHSVIQVGQHVYFISLEEDLVACYALTDDGRLEALPQATVACPAGSGPRHVVASEDGRNLYVVTEFSGEVLRFTRDAGTGALEHVQTVAAHDTSAGLGHSVIDEDPVANHYVWGADLHFAGPEGRWLVVSERTESTLAVLPVADSGMLAEPVSIARVNTQPRGFVVTPDGAHVVCPGEKSQNLGLYRVEDDGRLVDVAQAPNGAGANWARIVEA